jgi:hypothetical protein
MDAWSISEITSDRYPAAPQIKIKNFSHGAYIDEFIFANTGTCKCDFFLCLAWITTRNQTSHLLKFVESRHAVGESNVDL